MKGVVEVKDEHELTPEEWQQKTAGTWFADFKGLGDFVYACYKRSVLDIDDRRFPKALPLTEIEQQLKAWLEGLKYFAFPITLDTADGGDFLMVYIDTPDPTKLFILSRAAVAECEFEIICNLCLRMINRYRSFTE